MKIVRKRNAANDGAYKGTSQASAEQPASVEQHAEQVHDYDAIIVEAAEQDLKQTPTSSSLVLIDLLAARMDAVDVFLPAALHMLEKSQLYSLSV